MILLIDNYDSFSYNLYQAIGSLVDDLKVIRNDELSVDEIAALGPSQIILSPGPGRPEDGGVMIELIRKLGHKIPMLGVCLGHQAICAAFGAVVTYAPRLMHGKSSTVSFDSSCPLFAGLDSCGKVARYHSLAVDESTLPSCLKVVSTSLDDNTVMAIAHDSYPIYGLQFHPESIMTEDGMRMLANFLSISHPHLSTSSLNTASWWA